MVGAINPPTSGEKTFEKYVENSKKAGSKPKNLRAGSAAAPGDPALRLGESPGDKNAGRLGDKAAGQTNDLAGAKPGGEWLSRYFSLFSSCPVIYICTKSHPFNL
jgi:hypothetical protein